VPKEKSKRTISFVIFLHFVLAIVWYYATTKQSDFYRILRCERTQNYFSSSVKTYFTNETIMDIFMIILS